MLNHRLPALSLLLSIACASAPARPVPPTTVLETGGVGFTVRPPVAGVHFAIGGVGCDTDGAGIAYCVPVPTGATSARVTVPDGYNDVPDVATALHAGNTEIDPITLTRKFVGPVRVTDVGAAGQRGLLHVCGSGFPERHDFCDEDGRPWLFAGYASYTLIAEVAKGHDINAFFDEAAGYGANTIVALGMDLGPWAHEHDVAVDPRDPEWKTWLATLFDTAAAHQMRVALGVFQEAQALSDAERRQVWANAADVARGRWNVLLRCGNEDDVNGWRHDSPDCTRPANMQGVLVSSGSRGINNPPVPPNFDWAEWESRREPFKKAMDDAGSGAWEMYEGYEGFPPVPMPVVDIEPPFFHETSRDQYGDARWFEPWRALRLGLSIGVNFAGGTFGSSQSLEAKPNGPVAAECARQFFRGLRAGFLR